MAMGVLEGRAREGQRSRLQKQSAVEPWGDVYYFLLDTTWAMACGVVLAGYLTLVAVLALPLIVSAAAADADTAEPHYDESSLPTSVDAVYGGALLFTATNVITMGFGPILPETSGAYGWGTAQQAIGIMFNVFVFSVMITKFQRPAPDLVFSEAALVLERDGELHLLLRMGNLRCNLLYHPDVRLSVLRPRRTREGEIFFETASLPLTSVPSVIAGVYTLAHKIDDESPMVNFVDAVGPRCVKEGDQPNWLLSVAVVARDAVFHEEIHAIKRYKPSDLVYGHRFADVMRVDPATGDPVVDFDAFDALIDVQDEEDGKRDADSETAAGAVGTPTTSKVGADHTDGGIHTGEDDEEELLYTRGGLGTDPDPEEPDWIPGVVYFVTGGYRIHRGFPIVAHCPFTGQVAAPCMIMGIPMRQICIDLDNKPEWFVRRTKHAQTPTVFYDDGSGDGVRPVEDSLVIFAWLKETFPVEAESVFVPEVQLPTDFDQHGSIFGALFPGLRGEPDADLDALKRGWRPALAPLEDALEAHGTLGIGGKLSISDFRCASALYFLYGLSPLFPGPLKNMDIFAGLPRIRAWISTRIHPYFSSVAITGKKAQMCLANSALMRYKMPGLTPCPVLEDEMRDYIKAARTFYLPKADSRSVRRRKLPDRAETTTTGAGPRAPPREGTRKEMTVAEFCV